MTDNYLRLSNSTLDRLSATVRQPTYAPAAVGVGQLHFGVGAFFRAHQAIYTDDAIAGGGGDWRVCGVSLRRPDMRDALTPQDCLYSVTAADGDGAETRVIAALAEMLVAPENPAAIIAALADPAIKIITLTVTEKGYCLDPDAGTLDLNHPEIAHDLENPARPLSVIGYLVAGLRARLDANRPLPAIVSCDNLPGNGALLRSAVLRFAEQTSPALTDAINAAAVFPSTMVDRIVPATTPADLGASANAIGLRDMGAVRTEPFSQWVIEDKFVNGRPQWEAGGALLVEDVEPFELAKLQLLNGAHSAIAYLGYLAGYEYVSDAMADPAFSAFIVDLQEQEVAPMTPAPPQMPLGPYMQSLRARFANPVLKHRTWQVAMDGSQKLPQRLLPVIRAQLDCGGPIARLCLAIAAWTQYVSAIDERGATIDVRDPLAEKLAVIGKTAGESATERTNAFLGLREVFGDNLPQARRFRKTLADAIALLRTRGAAKAVRAISEAAS